MKYQIRGTRYLKKYTAPSLTPVYAANVDAMAAAEGLCDQTWLQSTESTAQMTYHTTEVIDADSGVTGLDLNVQIRDKFDAALFCAEHKAGMHRAYAQAACYVFTLPDMSSYPKLKNVKLRVTSDPYNSSGVRLAVHVSDSLNIPVKCSEAREGIAHVEGAMPRESRLGGDGKTYWYAATGDVDIPVASVSLKRFLFVVVGIENYSIVRGDWLEGSAFIGPTIEIETDGEIIGWNGGTIEAAAGSTEIVIREAGSFSFKNFASSNGLRAQIYQGSDYCMASTDGGPVGVQKENDDYAEEECRDGTKPMVLVDFHNRKMGISACYSQFREDKMIRCPFVGPTSLDLTPCASWSFAPWPYLDIHNDKGPAFLARKKLLTTFSLPLGFYAKKIRLDWTVDSKNVGFSMKMQHNLWILPGVASLDYSQPALQRHELYTGELDNVSGWRKIVSLSEYIIHPDGPSVSHAFDLPFPIGVGPHTLLFTVYADQDLQPETGEVEADGTFPAGTGWTDSTVYGYSNFLIFGGAFGGGWNPTVTLIG